MHRLYSTTTKFPFLCNRHRTLSSHKRTTTLNNLIIHKSIYWLRMISIIFPYNRIRRGISRRETNHSNKIIKNSHKLKTRQNYQIRYRRRYSCWINYFMRINYYRRKLTKISLVNCSLLLLYKQNKSINKINKNQQSNYHKFTIINKSTTTTFNSNHPIRVLRIIITMADCKFMS